MLYYKVVMEHYGVPIDDFLLEMPNCTKSKNYEIRLEAMIRQWLIGTNARRKKFGLRPYERKEFFPYVKFLGKSQK